MERNLIQHGINLSFGRCSKGQALWVLAAHAPADPTLVCRVIEHATCAGKLVHLCAPEANRAGDGAFARQRTGNRVLGILDHIGKVPFVVDAWDDFCDQAMGFFIDKWSVVGMDAVDCDAVGRRLRCATQSLDHPVVGPAAQITILDRSHDTAMCVLFEDDAAQRQRRFHTNRRLAVEPAAKVVARRRRDIDLKGSHDDRMHQIDPQRTGGGPGGAGPRRQCCIILPR